jgi:hypothetical protein
MEPGVQMEPQGGSRFCPQCGSEQKGYFCQNCGELMRGQNDVLCPRCHQVVPAGGFCPQCGQSLSGVALTLRQLAAAGDTFWVTAEAATPATSLEPATFMPDNSVQLAAAELPAWLAELPTESAPADVQPRIYPALQPIQNEQSGAQQGRFLILLALLLVMLLLGLLGFSAVLLMRAVG